MNPLAKLMNFTRNRTSSAADSKDETRCICANCKKQFVLLAIALCPECGSRQVRRADVLELHADALAQELAAASGTMDGAAQTLKEIGMPKVSQLLTTQAASANAVVDAYVAARAARN